VDIHGGIMTRSGNNMVHLGIQDWLIIAALLLPLVVSSFLYWSSVQRQIAEMQVHQGYILERLEQLEGSP
jgi:hypothetical protein